MEAGRQIAIVKPFPKQFSLHNHDVDLTRTEQVFALLEKWNAFTSFLQLKGEVLEQFEVQQAAEAQLKVFHTAAFLRDLQKNKVRTQERINFGKESKDCPFFDGFKDYTYFVAGSGIQSAKRLIDKTFKLVINWPGGWHHGMRDYAAGFCYTNDLVFAIQALKSVGRVLYLDIDLHHGDGVQDFFLADPAVLTVSLHYYSDDFFPVGTGQESQCGPRSARYRTMNINVPKHTNGGDYLAVFQQVVERAFGTFQPAAVVLQAGADSLAFDNKEKFDLSIRDHAAAVMLVVNKCREGGGIPLLVTGGGGYNVERTVLCWAWETVCMLGVEQSVLDHIKQHDGDAEVQRLEQELDRCRDKPNQPQWVQQEQAFVADFFNNLAKEMEP